MHESRLSVNLYLTNSARPTAARESGSQTAVTPSATLTATSPACGPAHTQGHSYIKSWGLHPCNHHHAQLRGSILPPTTLKVERLICVVVLLAGWLRRSTCRTSLAPADLLPLPCGASMRQKK